MADKSSIEWLTGEDGVQGSTWTPIIAIDKKTGRRGWHCEVASEGCGVHLGKPDQKGGCYANQINKGFFNLGTGHPYLPSSRKDIDIRLDEEVLMAPLHWKKPRRVFPCSMTDWMADFVKDEWIDKMLAVAALCPQHEFLFLTKQAARVPIYCRRIANCDTYLRDAALALGRDPRDIFLRGGSGAQLRNVVLGFSAENQHWFDKRAVSMRAVAASGWRVNVSLEPLLGPVSISSALLTDAEWDTLEHKQAFSTRSWLEQVIIGGDSGPHARPFNLQWARTLIAQCKEARIPAFMKQAGAWPYDEPERPDEFPPLQLKRGSKKIAPFLNLKHKKGGDLDELPPELNVRQYPRINGKETL